MAVMMVGSSWVVLKVADLAVSTDGDWWAVLKVVLVHGCDDGRVEG
jgi:hypothetical protein